MFDFLDHPIFTVIGVAFCFYVVYADVSSEKPKKGKSKGQRFHLSRNAKLFLFLGILLSITFVLEIIEMLTRFRKVR